MFQGIKVNYAGPTIVLNSWSSNHSLTFLQVCLGSLSCWKMTSLIDNIWKRFGHLNSGFCLVKMRWIAWRILAEASLAGWPPVDFCKEECSSEWSLEIVAVLIPVVEAIEQIEWWASSWERMVFFWVVERDLMVVMVKSTHSISPLGHLFGPLFPLMSTSDPHQYFSIWEHQQILMEWEHAFVTAPPFSLYPLLK